MKEKSCMFTGHRDIPESKRAALGALLRERCRALAERGYTRFIAGGAIGFDTMAAEAVLDVRREMPEVELYLYLPCREQDKYWSESDRRRYREICAAADDVRYISERYTRGCMHLRNRAMVDDAAICIAFLEKESGGTAYTVKYAYKTIRAVMNLNDSL